MDYPITPVPKPRMTQRDKWSKRKSVLKYWAFKDEVRLHKVNLPGRGAHVTFILPMPKSWPRKKKSELNRKPHQQKPDIDNLGKALLDAIFDEDCQIWDIRLTKIWGYEGKIIID